MTETDQIPPTPMLSQPHVYKGRRRSVSFFGPLSPHYRYVWDEWFTRHGINPLRVAYPGGVAADDVDCFVEFFPAGSDPEAPRVPMERVQLEAPALPFPVTL